MAAQSNLADAVRAATPTPLLATQTLRQLVSALITRIMMLQATVAAFRLAAQHQEENVHTEFFYWPSMVDSIEALLPPTELIDEIEDRADEDLSPEALRRAIAVAAGVETDHQTMLQAVREVGALQRKGPDYVPPYNELLIALYRRGVDIERLIYEKHGATPPGGDATLASANASEQDQALHTAAKSHAEAKNLSYAQALAEVSGLAPSIATRKTRQSKAAARPGTKAHAPKSTASA